MGGAWTDPRAPYKMPRTRPHTTTDATTHMRAVLSLFPTDLAGKRARRIQSSADGRKKR